MQSGQSPNNGISFSLRPPHLPPVSSPLQHSPPTNNSSQFSLINPIRENVLMMMNMGFGGGGSLGGLGGTDTLCETAARILFMNVNWTKSVPAFVSLPLQDQLLLLEESYRELFVLGAAQFSFPLHQGSRLIQNINGGSGDTMSLSSSGSNSASGSGKFCPVNSWNISVCKK